MSPCMVVVDCLAIGGSLLSTPLYLSHLHALWWPLRSAALVDEDRLALVVRTTVLNQHTGFVIFIDMIKHRTMWRHIPQHICHILTHEPRFIVYHHCHHFTEALIPIMGLISLQYTERTWNGPETDLQRYYNGYWEEYSVWGCLSKKRCNGVLVYNLNQN